MIVGNDIGISIFRFIELHVGMVPGEPAARLNSLILFVQAIVVERLEIGYVDGEMIKGYRGLAR